MPLVNGFLLLDMIKRRKLCAGAFNTTNIESTVGILRAIEESGVPTFVQVAPTNMKMADSAFFVEMVGRYAKNMDTPVALHLDHAKDLGSLKAAARSGFTSVMIDGAAFDFEENIEFTKAAVDFCAAYQIPVEAELGAIEGKEDDHVSHSNATTDPNQVAEFVERTGCHTLAISVGNVHGLEATPKLDFELLETISQNSPVPLVIHGGSGIPAADIRRIVDRNVVKLNIAGDLRRAYIRSVGEAYAANNNEHNLIRVLEEAADSVYQVVREKIQVLSSTATGVEASSKDE
ncbi:MULTISPECIES: class II aldolase [unclassified Luteococcus]|uniref:class II aldolase n=1 Tax=unclassified Luteococcus TaxID=2639923 RepID=UPI00313DA420